MISVVIPVFNRKPFVKEMINCIISQTYSDWELILVDDGSLDGTFEMMLQYSDVHDKIKVIKRERLPKGGQTCRNIGLDFASGEYIIFFDSDDLVSYTCLEKRHEFMELNKEIDFGIFPAKSFSDPLYFDKMSSNVMIWGVKRNNDDLSLFLSANHPFIVWTNIYRRLPLIEKKIRWDENVMLYQDFDFNISTLSSRLKYKYSTSKREGFDYFYRLNYEHDTISKHHVSKEKFSSTIYLINKVFCILELNDSSKYKNIFFSFILNYYKNIINSKSYEYIPDYLKFCKQYYKNTNTIKLEICFILIVKIKKYRIQQVLFKILLFVLFPKREFFEIIKYRFKNFIYLAERTISREKL